MINRLEDGHARGASAAVFRTPRTDRAAMAPAWRTRIIDAAKSAVGANPLATVAAGLAIGIVLGRLVKR